MPPDIPIIGARTAIWVVAELHLLLAAFILGAPIFIVISEYLGLRTGDQRFDRLAKETMRVVVVSYSITALFGGLFAFLIVGLFPEFTAFLFDRFFGIFAVYGVIIIVETMVMYLYWYSWDSLSNRKWLHLSIGVLLNILGTVVMFLMNGVGSFMLTPPDSPATATLWQLINNDSWTGLNLHRFIANISFGGFMVGLFAAFSFLTAKRDEERAFYDWMGYIGNFIGVGAMLTLPIAGYVLARELFSYDAGIITLLMADKLSWFFEVQGLLVVLLFTGATYYMWLSIRRISGGARFQPFFRLSMGVIFVGTAVWITPGTFLADLTSTPGETFGIVELTLPERAGFIGVMATKGVAVTAVVLVTFFTYLLYRRAIVTGRITWGVIDPRSQYVLILLPAISVFTMGIMGAIRELARRDFHIYLFLKDTSEYSTIPTLAYTATVTGVITLIFFVIMAFIFWLALKLGKGGETVEPRESEALRPEHGQTA